MNLPGIVVAGTNSGCGKTTLSMGIMAALVQRGFKVQPYKVGPDYIDPMFHTFITGKESRNLDSWMLSEDTVRALYQRHAPDADIAVIEGVMGMYDGYGGLSLEGSTADVSRILGVPVILVVNGEAMSLSAAALVKGFAEFDPKTVVAGVILNQISGDGHYRILKEAILEHTKIPVLGYLQRSTEWALPNRHLGLVTSVEVGNLKEKAAALAKEIERTVDLGRLIKIAQKSTLIQTGITLPVLSMIGRVRIGVARDQAFCFYYKDNLEMLEMLGAALVYFSPIGDACLPEDIDGLYFGGGYPEVWAEALEENHSMKEDIQSCIKAELPAYAECGGLMYLSQSIQAKEGKEFKMVGLIPGKSRMTSSLKRFGYVSLEVAEKNILAEKDFKIRAHEFHYSETLVDEGVQTCFQVLKHKNGHIAKSWDCGFKVHNLLAGYPHLHFWANPDFAKGFIKSCLKYKAHKGV